LQSVAALAGSHKQHLVKLAGLAAEALAGAALLVLFQVLEFMDKVMLVETAT
jgi:hypothetical protein